MGIIIAGSVGVGNTDLQLVRAKIQMLLAAIRVT